MNYNKKNINIISFFISLIIFLIIISILNFCSSKLNKNLNISQKENVENEDIYKTKISSDILVGDISEWKIEIEKLNLNAEIKEGTDESVIKESVGHYTQSNYLYGNVVLKAYNVSEYKNYFANLKELEISDEVKYVINGEEYNYKVISNTIINNEKDAINKTEKNTLTLITYIKDMPNKRRCVIATQS